MSAAVDHVAAAIRAHRYRYTSEDELQEGIAAALRAHDFDPEREVRLSSRDRIDIVVDTVGIEVKVAGSQTHPFGQLKRYAEHEEISGLILVTNRWHTLPEEIGGKPLEVVSLAGAGAVSAPVTHTEQNGCFHIDGVVGWYAHCACGWSGERREGSNDADLAHRDYRRHVVDALGDAAFYAAAVVCVNCDYRGDAQLLIGTDVWSGTCPMCNCSGRLRPEKLYDERKARGEVL